MNTQKSFILFILFTIGLCIVSHISSAQQVSVKGRITGTNGEELPYSSACILQVSDSTLVSCTTADSLGYFVLENLPYKKHYLLFSSFVGYGKRYQEVTLSGTNTDLGDIAMNENTGLSEVVVSGTRALLEHQQGMLVYHVERAASTGGSSAWEALGKSPGVFTTEGGGISLNGKQGVAIYINGKEFHADGEALENMLKSMPAENISKIELISNPDARYDAATQAVINIVLKQKTSPGFFGSVTGAYGIGLHSRYRTGANLNFLNDKWNMFFSVNADNAFIEKQTLIQVAFEDTETLEQHLNERYKAGSLTYRADINYNLTPRHTVGLIADGNFNNKNSQATINSVNTLNDIPQSKDNLQKSDNDLRLMMLNANYKGESKTGKAKYTADLNYVNYLDPETLRSYTGETVTHSEAQQQAEVWIAKADVVRNLNNGITIGSGAKYSSSAISNFVRYQEKPDENYHLDQTEDILGAYAKADYSADKWSFSAGIRVENTNMEATASETVVSEDTYWKWFPSASIEWTPSGKNAFALSLSSSVDRPDFGDLNPSQWWINEYTYVEGNPLLKPAYSNTLEFHWVWQQQLVTGLYYTNTRDAFMQIPEQDNDTKLIRYTQYNIDHKYEYAAYFTLPIGLTKWWTMSLTPEYEYVRDRSDFMDKKISNDYSMVTFQMNNEFVISSKWGITGEVSGFYVSPQYQGIYRIEQVYQVSAGLKKKLLRDKATLSLNVTDIFNSRSPKASIDFYDQQSKYVFKDDTRYFRISFTYNFGKSSSNKAKNDSADDLVNRLGR